MYTIKIYKKCKNPTIKSLLKDLMRSVPKANKSTDAEYYYIKCDTEQEQIEWYNNIACLIVQFVCLEELIKAMVDLKVKLEMYEFAIDAFFNSEERIFEYTVSLTKANLIIYFLTNEFVNLETYCIFNTKALSNMLKPQFHNKQYILSLIGKGKFYSKQGLTDILEIHDMIIEKAGDKLEKQKELIVIYHERELKCLSNNKIFDNDLLSRTYSFKIDEPEGDKFDRTCLLLLIFKPEIISFHNSVPKELQEQILETVGSFSKIYSGYKVHYISGKINI